MAQLTPTQIEALKLCLEKSFNNIWGENREKEENKLNRAKVILYELIGRHQPSDL
ncbi:MAG: hypothetical protein Q8O88_03965 [bacterium]|nr:hypothetical protein [bacterium]